MANRAELPNASALIDSSLAKSARRQRPSAVPISHLFSKIATVTVGSAPGVKFGIHKGLLASKSTFFKAALEGSFKEAMEGQVVLQDEDEDVFRVFNSWLYTGKLIKGCQGEDVDCNDLKDLLNLYIFGDKYGIPGFINAAIDSFIANTVTVGRAFVDTLIQLYTEQWLNTGPFRRVMVDAFLRHTLESQSLAIKAYAEYFPQAYLLDLMVATISVRLHGRRKGHFVDTCQYHTHPAGVECSQKSRKLDIRILEGKN